MVEEPYSDSAKEDVYKCDISESEEYEGHMKVYINACLKILLYMSPCFNSNHG